MFSNKKTLILLVAALVVCGMVSIGAPRLLLTALTVMQPEPPAPPSPATDSFHGAVYTSLGDGTAVNHNIYASKEDVYLNGGPQNLGGSGLPDGTYYFQVTNPNGGALLSTDNAVCRQLTVTGGVVTGTASTCGPTSHPNGTLNPANGSTPVKLMPFADTPNTGGEYKVWLIRQTSKTKISTTDPKVLIFKEAKTDNFKVAAAPPINAYTEVDVTGFTEVLPDTVIPVVQFVGGSYVVDEVTVGSVTGVPGWSVTVQDRVIVPSPTAPLGSVSFELYPNDHCNGNAAIAKGSNITGWYSAGPGLWASGFSDPFTFNTGGTWAFKATYNGTDVTLPADCEPWPIPTVATDILNGNKSVLNSTVDANSTIHDHATVSGVTIPNGSQFRFDLFANSTCTGNPDLVTLLNPNGADSTETVLLTGNSADSSDHVLTERTISYRATFIPGDNSLGITADNTCETTTVKGLPLTVTKTADGTSQYHWQITKDVDKTDVTAPIGSDVTFNYTVKVTPFYDGSTVSGSITVTNPNPWDVSVTLSDSLSNCTFTGGNTVSVPHDNNKNVSYSCSFSADDPIPGAGTNTVTATWSDASITETSATGSDGYTFVPSDNVATVKDPLSGNANDLLGTATAPPLTTTTYTYTHTVKAPSGDCVTVPNTAKYTTTNQSGQADKSVKVCGEPQLHLRKIVNNDNGGTAHDTDWTLTATGTTTPLSGSTPVDSVAGFLPGTYTLGETGGPDGYSASDYSCVKNGGDPVSGNSITLVAGDVVTCTITNDDIAPKLTVIKHVINDNGGLKGAADFTINVTNSAAPPSFAGSEAGTSVTVKAGALTVGENDPTSLGYKQTGNDCPSSIALAADVTCTITNDDIAPKLTVIKHVISDNGGLKGAADFTINVTNSAAPPSFAGSEAGTSVTVKAGALTVGENDPTSLGYKQTGNDCPSSIALAADVTCTITNDDIAPKLTVIKHVISDNGGLKGAADFTINVTNSAAPPSFAGSEAGTSVTVKAGALTVGENDPTSLGYKQTGNDCPSSIALAADVTCTITNDDIAPKLTVIKHVISDNGGLKGAADFTINVTNSAAPPSFAGSEAGTSVTVKAGALTVGENDPTSLGYKQTGNDCPSSIALAADVTCTITNDDIAPKLTVIKHVISDNGGLKGAADFTINVTNSAAPPSFAGSEAGTSVTVKAGALTVGENDPTSLGYKQTGNDCPSSIALAADVTCTITNDDIAPKLTVIKHVISDNGGLKGAADFTINVTNSAAPPSFAGSEAGTSVTVKAGALTVGENDPTSLGYKQTGNDCPSSIALAADVTCTITNDDIAPKLTVIKHVISDNGGLKGAADFTINVTNSAAPPSFAGSEAGTSVTVKAGALTVGENDPTSLGYKQTGNDCPSSIALAADVTCTITNDDIAPKLTVIKHVISDNGGLKGAADFTINVTNSAAPPSFAGSEAGTPVTVNAGALTVGENDPTSLGYKQTGNDCPSSIALAADVTCTITNNDSAAHLIVIKTVINNSAQSPNKSAADFQTTITGVTTATPTAAGVESPGVDNILTTVGSYTVDEGAHLGYDKTLSGECAGSIALGQTKTCTITNNDYGTWDVSKHVVNLYGGGKTASDFGFDVYLQGPTGDAPSDIGPTLLNGFHLHAHVPFGGDMVPVQIPIPPTAVVYVTEDANTTGYTKSYNSTVQCGVPGTGRTVDPDHAANCVITNSDIPASLTINKTTVGGTASSFGFTVTGITTTGGTISTTATVNMSGTTGSTTVTGLPAGTYTVTENNAPGWSLFSTNPSNGTVVVPFAGSNHVDFVNNKDATVIVKKKMIGGTASFHFSTTDGGPSGNISTDGGTTTPLSVPVPGASASVSSTEDATSSPWYLVNVSCNDSDSVGDLANRKATFNVTPGETVTCTFTNSLVAKSTVTDSSLCTFDVDSVLNGNQFRLAELMDGSPTTYRVNNTNPGQFYYNIFYAGNGTTNPNSPVKLTITIPYPFITQGATPLHVYSDVVVKTVGGQTCFTPGTEISNTKMTIPLTAASLNPTVGGSSTVDVTLPYIPGGYAYINLHLDYGLKKTTGWNLLAVSPTIPAANLPAALLPTAASFTTGQTTITLPAGLTILQNQKYTFNDSVPLGQGQTGGDPSVYSINDFKKTPGFMGQIVDSVGSGVKNINLVFKDDLGATVGTATTDADGFYLYVYKYTGKGTTWSVNIAGPQTGLVGVVPLTFTNTLQVLTPIKSNGVILTNFVISVSNLIAKQ